MKKYIFFLPLLFFFNDILSQTLDKADYVIFNFVHYHHGTIPPHLGNFLDEYYWLIPIDSINNNYIFKICPLHVDSTTQIEVDKCATGGVAHFYGLSEGASDKYVNEIDSFIKIINKNRKKIQTITLEWYKDKTRRKEKIDVYAIPISGVFCTCFQEYYRGIYKQDEFSGQIYVPFSDFKYNESFWNSQEWNIVKYADYSTVNFAALTPWGYQYRTGSLVKISK